MSSTMADCLTLPLSCLSGLSVCRWTKLSSIRTLGLERLTTPRSRSPRGRSGSTVQTVWQKTSEGLFLHETHCLLLFLNTMKSDKENTSIKFSAGSASGWTTSPSTAAPVKETRSCSLSSWTAVSQSHSWTATTGLPFTTRAGESEKVWSIQKFSFGLILGLSCWWNVVVKFCFGSIQAR